MNALLAFLKNCFDVLGDELLRLAITLIVIDRMLAWRERKRWRNIRPLVEIQIEAALGDFLRSWARWLGALQERGQPFELSDIGREALRRGDKLAEPTMATEDFSVFVSLCAGQPLPSASEPAFIDIVQPRQFAKELEAFLVSRGLAQDDPAWPAQTGELQRLLPRLAGLLERVPEQAQIGEALEKRQFVEHLNLLMRAIDPSLYSGEDWGEEIAHLSRADRISFGIIGAIMMMKVYRTSFRVQP